MLAKLYIKTLLIFILGLTTAQQTCAQQDYFIVKGKDTVYCIFKEPDRFTSAKKMKFTTENSEKTKTVHLDSVSEYRQKSLIYVKRLLPNETDSTFVQRIYRGKIDLYQQGYATTAYNAGLPGSITRTSTIGAGTPFQQTITTSTYNGGGGALIGSSTNVDLYAAKGKEPLAEIKTNGIFGSRKARMQRLYDLLADYPELLDKFKTNDEYSFESIKAVIIRYNDYFSSAKSYYITQKGDTVNCKIVDKIAAAESPDSLAYKTPTATKFKALALDSIKEYTFLGVVLTKRTLPGMAHQQFVSCLEKGKLSLYQHVNAAERKSWYVLKGTGDLVLIKGKGSGKQQAKAFSELIADYPELLEQFTNSDYEETIIRRTIMTYNKLKKG